MGDYDEQRKIRETIAEERRRKVRDAVSGAKGDISGGSSVLNYADYANPNDDNDNDDESLPQDEEENVPAEPTPRKPLHRPSNVKKGSNIQLTEDLPGRSIMKKYFFLACEQLMLW
jgi:hypothetical protein